jgi:hypothetical protein
MEYFGAWGTLIHEKNLKSKISRQTPFNFRLCASLFQRQQQAIAVFQKSGCIHQFLADKEFHMFCIFCRKDFETDNDALKTHSRLASALPSTVNTTSLSKLNMRVTGKHVQYWEYFTL